MKCNLTLTNVLTPTKGLYVCANCREGIELPSAAAAKVTRRCPGVPPTLAEKSANYAKAIIGSRETVSDAEFEARSEACATCIRFRDQTRDICLHPECGCRVCGAESWFDKRRLRAQSCPVGRWHVPRWISREQRMKDTMRLMELLPIDTAAIVGVARSGLAPATEIAMSLHLPMLILDDYHGIVREAGHGQRMAEQAKGNGPIVAIDDSLASGRSMIRGKGTLQNHPLTRDRKILWAVVYTHPMNPTQADIHVVACHDHHLFEWNFPNSIYAGRTAWDIDGVLVTEGANPGRPYLVPRRQRIPLIVTGRLESERQATIAQMRWLGVEFDRLEMFPGSLADRDQPMAISKHKAKHYLASGLDWFIESCPIQAKEIGGLTGKRVICPATSQVF